MANELRSRMPDPSVEERENWRKRWDKYPDLAERILGVLLPEGQAPRSPKEAAARAWEVSKMLPEEDFDVAEGKGVSYFRISWPILDLRGINWGEFPLSGLNLCGARLEESYLMHAQLHAAELTDVHLEGAQVSGSHMEGAKLSGVHMENASLVNAHLEVASLWGAHLEGAMLAEAHLEGATLCEVHLEEANLHDAHLEGALLWKSSFDGARLDWIRVGKLEALDPECELPEKLRTQLPDRKTSFVNTEFLPSYKDFFTGAFECRNIRHFLKTARWKDLWCFWTERWFYTDFQGVRIDDADTVLAADLHRYVRDQQYLYVFRHRHLIGYKCWKWLAGCGDNIWLLAFWSLFVIVFFAVVYWLPLGMINAQAYGEDYSSIWEPLKWFFISFDIFSNLGVRATHPQTSFGVFVVFLETTLGFVALGTLIAVASNKWVRRS